MFDAGRKCCPFPRETGGADRMQDPVYDGRRELFVPQSCGPVGRKATGTCCCQGTGACEYDSERYAASQRKETWLLLAHEHGWHNFNVIYILTSILTKAFVPNDQHEHSRVCRKLAVEYHNIGPKRACQRDVFLLCRHVAICSYGLVKLVCLPKKSVTTDLPCAVLSKTVVVEIFDTFLRSKTWLYDEEYIDVGTVGMMFHDAPGDFLLVQCLGVFFNVPSS